MPRVTSPNLAYLSPPQLAERLGISPDKILFWLRSGQLRGFNSATNPAGRPRWRIALADVLAFEQSRAALPKAAAPRRQKASKDVIQFF